MPMNRSGRDEFEDPPESLPGESAEMPAFGPGSAGGQAAASKAEKARRKHEKKLMEIDGVVGVIVDRGARGEDVVVVFVRDDSVIGKLPKTLDRVPVHAEITGEFDAFADEAEEAEPPRPKPRARPKGKKPKPKPKQKKPAAKRKAAPLMDAAPEAPKKAKPVKRR